MIIQKFIKTYQQKISHGKLLKQCTFYDSRGKMKKKLPIKHFEK